MIIIEGLDGTGKTTLKDSLISYGFNSVHFDYDKDNNNIFGKYLKVISASSVQSLLDRSFISEVVYGNVIRKHSRISLNQLEELASRCSKKNTIIVYLYAPLKVLLSRRANDKKDIDLLQKYYSGLCAEYENVLKQLSKVLPIIKLDSTFSPHELLDKVKQFYLEEKYDLIYAGNISRDRDSIAQKEYWGGSSFHSSIASSLFQNKKIGVISGVGYDFDISIFESLGIKNICGMSDDGCNIFLKDSNSAFKLVGANYVKYPSIVQRIFTQHLHISLRKGVPVWDILNNPLIRYNCLSVDVISSSIDSAVKVISCFKNKISIIFCNLEEHYYLKERFPEIMTVVTNENRPVELWQNGKMIQMVLVPYNDSIIRTDGAGDSFIGGFLSMHIGNDLHTNLMRGVAVSWAAVSCEERYKINDKTLKNALTLVYSVNKKIISKLPKHIIVIGNPCSGKSSFSSFLVDYFSHYYISIDDYECLSDVFALDDALCNQVNVINVLEEFKDNYRVKTVIKDYLNLYDSEKLTKSLYTKANICGGHDIIRPELWDIILSDRMEEIDDKKNYVIQLSRGKDEQYMQYKNISKFEVYDEAIRIIVNKLHSQTDDILIINMSADNKTRLIRNQNRKNQGGHYVSEIAMNTIYGEDCFAQRYADTSGTFIIDGIAIQYITIDNSLTTNNLSKHFHNAVRLVLEKFNN